MGERDQICRIWSHLETAFAAADFVALAAFDLGWAEFNCICIGWEGEDEDNNPNPALYPNLPKFLP